MNEDDNCTFCGDHTDMLPLTGSFRCGRNEFCKSKICYKAFDRFHFGYDLSYGLPINVKCERSYINPNERCHFCGNFQNLLIVPTYVYNKRNYNVKKFNIYDTYQVFCKNNTCLNSYVRFICVKTIDVPFIIKERIGCVCNGLLSSNKCNQLADDFEKTCAIGDKYIGMIDPEGLL